MLHACVERFDVMGGRGNILGWDGEVNKVLDGFLMTWRSYVGGFDIWLTSRNENV
jgi:hypothetical protein